MDSNETDRETPLQEDHHTSDQRDASKPLLVHLDGLNPQQAREFVHQHLVAMQTLNLQLTEHEQELNKWQKRVQLAQKSGRQDLLSQAHNRLNELEEKKQQLVVEQWSLKQELEEMQKELSMVSAFQPSVDAHQLLDQMQAMVGEEKVAEQEFDQALQSEQLDQQLKALKEKLKNDAHSA